MFFLGSVVLAVVQTTYEFDTSMGSTCEQSCLKANEKRARSRKDPVSVLEAFEFEEIFGGQRLNKMHLAEMCPMNIIEVAEEIVHKIIDDVEHIHWIHSKKAWGAIITTLTGIIYLNFDRMTFLHSERKLKADRQKRFKAKLRRLY